MSKHTPGPWKQHDRISYNHTCLITTDGGRVGLARVLDRGNPQQTLANAALIASAPELLEALKDMSERWELVKKLFNGIEYNGVCPIVSKNIADEVIAKAEGR